MKILTIMFTLLLLMACSMYVYPYTMENVNINRISENQTQFTLQMIVPKCNIVPWCELSECHTPETECMTVDQCEEWITANYQEASEIYNVGEEEWPNGDYSETILYYNI